MPDKSPLALRLQSTPRVGAGSAFHGRRQDAHMKTRSIVFLISGVICIAIISRRSVAEYPTRDELEMPSVSAYFEPVIDSLIQRGDTNTVSELVSLVRTMQEQREALDIAETVGILKSLRSGDTNAAIQRLESRLDGGLYIFNLPSIHPVNTNFNEILQEARNYRAKYPPASH